MQLKSIHFSGFKSFVDSTTFKLPARIIGIVGPNGCGKSNVIDAVRWVMGESSAKTLRGESMTDVIFNGSSARSAVGKATVELVFDNSDGKAPGVYGQYAEISVKRSLSRDGQSEYFLNSVRCRRKDITEIFLGTGLGPRSYSIIEQGMVSRIVEARPEDLRTFVEEAAGISKYKEKRRETENRIRHTRENLDRVEDIVGELETQLRRLDRQSKQAKRYKELKGEQRHLKAQTLALKWQVYDDGLANFDVEISRKEKHLDGYISVQRESESEIELFRQQMTQSQESLNHTQGKFYSIGADISSLEQRIKHEKETYVRRQAEQQRIEDEIKQTNARLTEDQLQQEQLSNGHVKLFPQVERLREDYTKHQALLVDKEKALQHWQLDWDRFQSQINESIRNREVLKANIEHLESRQQELQNRIQNAGEKRSLNDEKIINIVPHDLRLLATEFDNKCLELEKGIESITAELNQCREKLKFIDDDLKKKSENALEIGGKLESLKELQKAALGQNDEKFNEWLSARGLQNNDRLTQLIKVESGWEKAVDTALRNRTASVCVSSVESIANSDDQLAHIELNFIEDYNDSFNYDVDLTNEKTLLSKLDSSVDLSGYLANVYIADSVDKAMQQRGSLIGNQFFITQEGTSIGRNWMTIAKKQDVNSGLIARDAQINQLSKQHKNLSHSISDCELQRSDLRNKLNEFESSRTTLTHELNQTNSKRTQAHSQLAQQEEKLRELTKRNELLEQEAISLAAQIKTTHQDLESSKLNLQNMEISLVSNEQSREQYELSRESLRADYDKSRLESEQIRDLLDNDNIRLEKISTALESIQETISRSKQQLTLLQSRQLELFETNSGISGHSDDKTAALQKLLASQNDIEKDLTEARNHVASFDTKIHEQDRTRRENEQLAMQMRNDLESSRLNKQELVVKQQSLKEQIAELEVNLTQTIESIPEDANFEEFKQNLDQLEQKISRLGTVNLLAIEEYEEQQERKLYLDKQHEDLSKALNTLEQVMHKIDKETKHRFKDTFDKLNEGFKEYFPKLFGGGSASLELTDDDLLSTGVTVMARPPGKRNSTIHLLSGGEKALTAVSLMFSLFQLNPAPFCILDEVDAPLDDANVERYCRTLKQMAEHTQLMFITHNKITMEYANILIGVTMQEPGVSRLVTVDVEKAMEITQQG